MNDNLTLYLLTIRGTLSPTTLEEARKVHNMTAGDPGGVAAAKSLGDVSHMVYIPLPHDGHTPSKGAGEFLIMDLWHSMDGPQHLLCRRTCPAGRRDDLQRTRPGRMGTR